MIEQAPDVSKRWLILGCAFAVQVAISMVATCLPVLLPYVKSEFHLTFGEAALVVNFSFFGSFLAILLAGWLVDEFGDGIVLVLGCISVGISAIACSFTPLFLVLLLFVFFIGIGTAMPLPAGTAALRRAFPLHLRGTIISVRQAGIPIGSFLAALLLPTIAIAAGWRTALLTAGAGAVFVGIFCFFLYPMAHLRQRRSVIRARLSLRPIVERDILVVGIAGMLMVMGQFVLVTFLIAYLIHDWHESIATAGLTLAIALVTGAVSRILWGTVSDRLLAGDRKRSLMLSGGTAAIGCLGLGVAPTHISLPWIVLIVLVCAIGVLGWNGVLTTWLSELAGPGAEGRTVASGSLLGPLLFGLVIDYTESFRVAWVLLATILGVSILIFSRAPSRVPI